MMSVMPLTAILESKLKLCKLIHLNKVYRWGDVTAGARELYRLDRDETRANSQQQAVK